MNFWFNQGSKVEEKGGRLENEKRKTERKGREERGRGQVVTPS